MKLLISQNVSPRTTAAAIRRELSQFAASQSRDGRGPLKRNQVYRGRPDGPTGSQGGSADRSIKERGGRVPPRKAQEGVLGRWDLAR